MGGRAAVAAAVVLMAILAAALVGCRGAPIQPPDLTRCQRAVATSVVGTPITVTYNCCMPLPTSPVADFAFEAYPPQKLRKPAHKADAAYIETYKKAYALMRALPDSDPRSFKQQADLHCAFCNGAYRQTPESDVVLQIHFSWLFFPWHRWYLYFHERILASLLGDPSFSLLFWNYDDQSQTQDGGNSFPSFFADTSSSLYDPNRNPATASDDNPPATIVRLYVLSNTTNTTDLLNENLNQMYQDVVTAASPELFMGGAYRIGTDIANSTVIHAPLGGSFENGVHNAIHFWTGNPTLPLFQDMGVFTVAAYDPIFYAHHSNVDRLWEVWRHLPTNGSTSLRQDHTDSDFLNAEFYFYDENAKLVKVNVKDALDNTKLGIAYTRVESDNLWINYSPQPATNGSSLTQSLASTIPLVGLGFDDGPSIELGKRFSARVKQPSIKEKKSHQLEVLVIQGVELQRESFSHLAVFVNLPQANENSNTYGAEYVGTFNVIPSTNKSKHLKTNLKFEIGDNIRRIGIQDEDEIVVTIVVKSNIEDVKITIKGMKIEFE